MTPYIESIYDGVDKLLQRMRDEIHDCPDTKFVLLGYSQGALSVHVALRTIASDQLLNRVLAVGLIADPGRAGYASETIWSSPDHSISNGVYLSAGVQSNLSLLDGTLAGTLPGQVTGKTLSVCHTFDPVCATLPPFSLLAVGQHLNYGDMTQEMGKWLAEKVESQLK